MVPLSLSTPNILSSNPSRYYAIFSFQLLLHFYYLPLCITILSGWCQTVKIFLYPSLDLCKCSRLLLEIHLKLFMLFYRRCYPGRLKLLPPCCHIFGKTIISLSRSKNNLFYSPVFFNQWVCSWLVSRALAASLQAVSLPRWFLPQPFP